MGRAQGGEFELGLWLQITQRNDRPMVSFGYVMILKIGIFYALLDRDKQ